MKTRRRFGLFLFALLQANSVYAQPFPNRAVTLVVPFPAGGPLDATARTLAKGMTDRFGQTVIIENKPGAGGIVGTEYVVNAKPDGHTLLYATTGILAVYPFVYKKLSFDPDKSLVPVHGVVETQTAMIVRGDSPYTSLPSFIEAAKKAPGKLNYATVGPGSIQHIAGELLQTETDIKMTAIPYKGATPSLNDLLAGTIELMFSSTSTMKPLIEAGKLRALAVTGPERLPGLAEVKTFSELGFPGVEISVGSMVMAPAGTPSETAERIAEVVSKTLDDQALAETLQSQGATVMRNLSRQRLADWLAERRIKIKQVVERAGIEPE